MATRISQTPGRQNQILFCVLLPHVPRIGAAVLNDGLRSASSRASFVPKHFCAAWFRYDVTLQDISGTTMNDTLRPGRYRHYKGKDYLVIGVARHSETEEELVVYRTDYGDRSLWIRPLKMFQESVEINGMSVPRFQFVGE